MRKARSSILLSGAPASKVTPDTVHNETEDEASVGFNPDDGTIESLNTPDEVFQRVHETMHMRHTTPELLRQYYHEHKIRNTVWQVTEDCRIHIDHWPWRNSITPQPILDGVKKFLREEMRDADKEIAKKPDLRGSWADFATRLRQAAIIRGVNGQKLRSIVRRRKFATKQQEDFAYHILKKIWGEDIPGAAIELETAFFDPPPDIKLPSQRTGEKVPARSVPNKSPPMDIVELPLTENIPGAKRGYRRASSGSRLHRPSLRKPVLPQRLFLRHTPRKLDGTILVDASGSMGSFEQVTRWLKEAPFGTIAYYAGSGRKGWLYIYARNGKCAKEPVDPEGGGNTVDGSALDWLMSQPKPRKFITDRGFCGADDSEAQVMRLARLERDGEIEVVDYAHE